MSEADGPQAAVDNDQRYMCMALRLARRGRGWVEPNPMVGCVIVRDGRVIGRGYHRKFGGPHAEVAALADCARNREAPAGATAYVTLEPCCHHGKTPPCVDALLRARVGRVVAAIEDPNPPVSGGGIRALREAGVRVDVGICAAEASALAAPFLKRVRTGRPWVIAKWAQSLDGKIATHTGDSKWITDQRMRAHANRMRGRVDAIVVGVNTVLGDDPQLTARLGHPRRTPTRVVIDSLLKTPASAHVAVSAQQIQTWIFCREQASESNAAMLNARGCVVRRVRGSARGVDLECVLDELGAAGMTNVIVEGGGALLGSFLDNGLADEVHVYIAPLLIGGRMSPGAWNGDGADRVGDALKLSHSRLMKLGEGWILRSYLKNA